MTSITVTIPLPPADVRSNARVHWSRRAKAIRSYRVKTKVAALVASKSAAPLWVKASVQITAHFPTHQHLDPSNLIDALKGAFDGLEDAKIIVNDKNLWPERPVILTKQINPRIELTITEEL